LFSLHAGNQIMPALAVSGKPDLPSMPTHLACPGLSKALPGRIIPS
jgi:hypothetical protein